MSVYSDIITDLFRKTVIGVVQNFRNYLSVHTVINVLQSIINDISNDDNNEEITCTGCLEGQPNQQAHMDIGGCMYEEL
jgi:hypothetical protein